VRDWLPWLGFLLLCPLVLYILLGGLKYGMDRQQEKVDACVERGGWMDPRNNVCVKRIEVP
jgi:hypothetical protein